MMRYEGGTLLNCISSMPSSLIFDIIVQVNIYMVETTCKHEIKLLKHQPSDLHHKRLHVISETAHPANKRTEILPWMSDGS